MKSMYKPMVNIICIKVYTGIYTEYNVVCCSISAYVFTKCVRCYCWIGEKKKKYLLPTIAYNSSLRPATNQMRPTDLNVSIDLIRISKQYKLKKKSVHDADMAGRVPNMGQG